MKKVLSFLSLVIVCCVIFFSSKAFASDLAVTIKPLPYIYFNSARVKANTLSVTVSGGTAPYSYQWYYATGPDGYYSKIDEATESTYTPVLNAGSWYYLVKVKDATGNEVSSEKVYYKVAPTMPNRDEVKIETPYWYRVRLDIKSKIKLGDTKLFFINTIRIFTPRPRSTVGGITWYGNARVIDNLKPNTTYFAYAAAAVNYTEVPSNYNTEFSSYSDVISFTTPDLPVPKKFTVSTVSINSVKFKWDMDSSQRPDRFEIYDSIKNEKICEVGKNLREIIVPGLQKGRTYKFQIRMIATVDDNDYHSNFSPEKSYSVPKDIGTTKLTAKASSYQSVNLSWNTVSVVNGYTLYRATSKNGKYSEVKDIKSGNTLAYTNSKLKTGTTYYYKIRAYKLVYGIRIYGSYSGVVSAKPVLSKTSMKLKKASSKSIKLTWKKVSGASGYKIYRATSKKGKYSTITDIKKGSTVTYTNKKLKTGKTYYYKIRSYRIVNGKRVYGSYSSVVSLKLKK